MEKTHVYDGFLSLDPSDQLLLLNVHNEIPAFEVAGYGNSHVEFANGLVPFIRERGLLLCLLGAGSCLLLRCGI